MQDVRVCIVAHPEWNSTACEGAIVSKMQSAIIAAGAAAIAIAIIQVICLIFSCYLFVKIPQKQQDETLLEDK